MSFSSPVTSGASVVIRQEVASVRLRNALLREEVRFVTKREEGDRYLRQLVVGDRDGYVEGRGAGVSLRARRH